MGRRGVRPGGERRELHFQLLDAVLLLGDQRGLRLDLAAQLLQLLGFHRRARRRAGASGEQRGDGKRAEAQADSPEARHTRRVP